MRLHSEPELLAVMVLQSISDPNVIKLIPRISLLTLLELHGKSTYPVVKYAVKNELTDQAWDGEERDLGFLSLVLSLSKSKDSSF